MTAPMPSHIAELARAAIEAARAVLDEAVPHRAFDACYELRCALDAYDQAVADDARAALGRTP